MARIHHDHCIAQLAHHTQIMGDEKHGSVHLPVQVPDQIQNLRLNRHIQCRRGFIGDQDLRLTGQRHGNHHTLTHTSGHLMRILMSSHFRIGDSHCPHHIHSFLHGLFFVHTPMKSQRLRDLLSALDNRIQRSHRFLKNHGHLVSPQFLHLFFGKFNQILPFIQDLASRNPSGRIGNQLQNRQRRHALAASALSHDSQLLSFM